MLGERIESYWERVIESGGVPIDLHGPDAGLNNIDALILTAGYDIVPSQYGQPPHEKVRFTDADRDEWEIALLHEALSADLPILAICRGMQVLNVALGGALVQHLEGHVHPADYRSEGYPSRWHTVRIERDSRLRALLGADEVQVNSRHHQGVTAKTLAGELTAVATSPDGVIEAVESPSRRWLLGVQWHPERLEEDHPEFAEDSLKLFRALVEEVGGHQAR